MKAVFIETAAFTKAMSGFLTDQDFAKWQRRLMGDPEEGDVIPGCGGLRKVRISDPSRGKGKRGGARVIYLHVPMAKRFYLLDIYGKDEKDDLSYDEKKQLRKLAERLKREAIATYERWLGENM